MNNYNDKGLVNIGWGEDVTILELAELIKKIVEYNGKLVFDTTKPDGTPRKLMDVSKLNNLGWKATINLEEGIKKVFEEIKNTNWN